MTFCVFSTRSATWVNAFFIYACEIQCAVTVTYTLCLTIWRLSDKSRETWTWSLVIDDSAYRIQSARRGFAKILNRIHFCWRILINNQLKKSLSVKLWNANSLKSILRFSVHLMNEFPVKPSGQLQIGLWLMHWQTADIPHAPTHGSTHFWFVQTWFLLQSELLKHCGLHVGGFPMYPGTQVQTAWLFTGRQILFGPHGDGAHGSTMIGSMRDDYRKIELKIDCDKKTNK